MDFSMSVGDSIPISNGYTSCLSRKGVETFIGTEDEELHFLLDWDSIIIDEEQTFILQRDVGIFFFKVSFHSSEYLIGTIIDGMVYGDTTVVSVETMKKEIPDNFSLSQNYPNPFNPSTTIRFDIAKATYLTLKVYNLLGEEMEVLLDQYHTPGTYEFKWTPEGLPSGLYLYHLETTDFTNTKKVTLSQIVTPPEEPELI